MHITRKIKSKRAAMIIGAFVFMAVIFTTESLTAIDAYASQDFWDLRLGDRTVAVFSTKEDADKVISGVMGAYTTEGSRVLSIIAVPKLSAVQTTYKYTEQPEFADVDETTDYLLKGTKTPVAYKVKAGDCLWSIAKNSGFTLEQLKEMNRDKNLNMLYPGDMLNLCEIKPFVVVTTEEIIVYERDIPFETEEVPSPDMYVHTSKVKQKGMPGVEKVTALVKKENGRTVDSKEQSAEVIKEPVKKVVLVGRAKRPAAKGSSGPSASGGRTYSGDGEAVAAFALQFEGNPYKYGGTSLTNGADCSGFVMAVYDNFGISLPHSAVSMRSCGRSVTLAEAKPGDIICNPSHVGIYIGGGRMINAVNERRGIAVTSVTHTGSVVTVRRIVE